MPEYLIPPESLCGSLKCCPHIAAHADGNVVILGDNGDCVELTPEHVEALSSWLLRYRAVRSSQASPTSSG